MIKHQPRVSVSNLQAHAHIYHFQCCRNKCVTLLFFFFPLHNFYTFSLVNIIWWCRKLPVALKVSIGNRVVFVNVTHFLHAAFSSHSEGIIDFRLVFQMGTSAAFLKQEHILYMPSRCLIRHTKILIPTDIRRLNYWCYNFSPFVLLSWVTQRKGARAPDNSTTFQGEKRQVGKFRTWKAGTYSHWWWHDIDFPTQHEGTDVLLFEV